MARATKTAPVRAFARSRAAWVRARCATKDGHAQTFIVHPDRGGPHPLILFLMDAPAIWEELRDMARRFATSGYYVMLPNLYYRAGVLAEALMPLPGLMRDAITRPKND